MLNKELSVIVKCGYQDVAESKDPKLCAEVLALLASHGVENPETPEQRLVRELEDKVSTAQGREYDQKTRADRLEKQVAELSKAVAELKAQPPMVLPTNPAAAGEIPR